MPRLPDLLRATAISPGRRPHRRTGPPGAFAGAAVALVAAVVAANALIQWGANRRHPARGQFIEVDGVPVHYLEKGVGAPIVLVHGNGVSAEDFVNSGLFDRLAEHHRVIAFDRPGCGHTPRPRRRVWTARAQARLLMKAIEALGLNRPVVVGHSFGAQTALMMALEAPETLGGVALLSGYFHPSVRADSALTSGPALPIVGDLIRYTVAPALGWLSAAPVFRLLFAPAKVPPGFSARLPLSMTLRPSQIRASAADGVLMIPGAARTMRRASEIDLPTLILTGDGDRIVSPRYQSERLARDIPRATLRVVGGAGHMIHHTAAAEVAEAILRFADQAVALREAPSEGPARALAH